MTQGDRIEMARMLSRLAKIVAERAQAQNDRGGGHNGIAALAMAEVSSAISDMAMELVAPERMQ